VQDAMVWRGGVDSGDAVGRGGCLVGRCARRMHRAAGAQ
jgi:hypothetical protein